MTIKRKHLLVIAFASFAVGLFWAIVGVGLKFLLPLGNGLLLLLIFFFMKDRSE